MGSELDTRADAAATEATLSPGLESAIPAHLRCPRTRQRRVPDDYAPPYPPFVARHAPAVKRVVMAYLGVQARTPLDEAAAAPIAAALEDLRRACAEPGGPAHVDRARYTDEAGHATVVTAAYWDDAAGFDAWFAAHGRAWTRIERPGVGTFSEILTPDVARYETLFSSPDRSEGIATLAQGMSGMVMEHAYWGGARDRIPASQTDALAPTGTLRLIRDGARVTVSGHDHVCLIRSGQDWSDTDADERRMYLEDVEPVLRAGMDFLRDEGRAIGCYANRYVTVDGTDGAPAEKRYGMSWWKSLAALEGWAESHPTHVAIFGAAMKYLSTLGPVAKLRLYHEVTVARADEQFFEYLNCREGTGMMGAG
jgi:aldoxime dehydratase